MNVKNVKAQQALQNILHKSNRVDQSPCFICLALGEKRHPNAVRAKMYEL